MMKLIHSITTLLLVILITSSITNAQLVETINKLKTDSDLKNASWAFAAYNITKDSSIDLYNKDLSLQPASTQKLFSTAVALMNLGKNYRFTTSIEYDGELDIKGTLNGNIYIKGSGDPSLANERLGIKDPINHLFNEWTTAIRNKGIKVINGTVIVDGHIYEDEPLPPTWSWDDMGNYYGAGALGFNIHENAYSLYYKTGANEGDSVHLINVNPELPGIHYFNHLVTGKPNSGDNGIIYAAPNTNTITITGTIPPNKTSFELKGSIPDPAYFCASSFAKYLNANGIKLVKKPMASNIPLNNNRKRELIITTNSPTLAELARLTNFYSINLYAEALLKASSYKSTGMATTPIACKNLIDILKKKGIDTKGLNLEDGSGLSRKNSMSVWHQIQLLNLIAKDAEFYKIFKETLPVVGRDGSVAGLLKQDNRGNIRAKSGSVGRVKSYCGYIIAKNGDLISFSMIANNFTCSSEEMKHKFELLLASLSNL